MEPVDEGFIVLGLVGDFELLLCHERSALSGRCVIRSFNPAKFDLFNKADPKLGHACIIDVDGLVVPGKYPPDVVGTPDLLPRK